MDKTSPAEGARAGQPARRRRIARAIVILLALPAAVVGAAVVWTGIAGSSRSRKASLATEVVKRGPLEITLTERGNLQSGNNLTLRCLVEGGAGVSILKIAEEGTLVEKDQVVVELDSSRLREDALVQQIKVDAADAALKIASANAEIQKMQNESDVASAALQLELARLDLHAYTDGEYVQTKNLVMAEIKIAHEYLTRAQEKRAFSERLMRRGFTTTQVLDADRVGLKRAQIDMESALEKRRVLDTYSHRRQLAEKESNARFYEAEFERVKLRGEAALSQRERNLLAAKRTFFVENERYKKNLQQIEACTIRTPRAGMVVYANNEGSRGPNAPAIYEGAVARERQPLIELPDVADMQVNARIHESKISLVSEGLPATIHIDAEGGRSFHGIVRQVALVPNSASWPHRDLKEYTALIRLTDAADATSALRPGMTAAVEILSDRLESVLQVPLESCVERGGRFFAWVLDDAEAPRRHEVKLGKSSVTACEVLAGLSEGEDVILNPRRVLPAEVARLEQELPATVESVWPLLKRPEPGRIMRPETPPDAAPETPRPQAPRQTPADAAGAPVALAAGAGAMAPLIARRPAVAQPSDDPMAVFNRLDQNHDAKVTESELPERMKQVLGRMDTNGDRAIDKDEWQKGAKAWSLHADRRAESGGG